MTQTGRQIQRVRCFLSCSVRPSDKPLVDAVARMLNLEGFDCKTVGRNYAGPTTIDDAIRDLVDQSDCLVGIATARFDATDRTSPDRSLTLATSYLLQEASAAHQRQLPFLVFRVKDVHLQGVTARNIYLNIEPDLRDGKAMVENLPLATSAVRDLHARALRLKVAKSRAQTLEGLGQLSMAVVGAKIFLSVVQSATRPDCFGEFYDDDDCDECSHRSTCRDEYES